MLGLLTYLWLHRKPVIKGPLAILAIALTIGASLLGLYGWINLKELATRDKTDYRFEHICWSIAIVAMATSALWAIVARHVWSWMTLATACCLSLYWSLMCIGPIY